jgi:hypothetical protein
VAVSYIGAKSEDTNEGGIVVGFSVLDTPYLVSNSEEGWTL